MSGKFNNIPRQNLMCANEKTNYHLDPFHLCTFKSNIELSNFCVFEKVTKTDNWHAIG